MQNMQNAGGFSAVSGIEVTGRHFVVVRRGFGAAGGELLFGVIDAPDYIPAGSMQSGYLWSGGNYGRIAGRDWE